MAISDAELNEDWIKTASWDLPFGDLDGLWSFFNLTGAPAAVQRGELVHFMGRAAWEAAPGQLKQEALAWLGG